MIGRSKLISWKASDQLVHIYFKLLFSPADSLCSYRNNTLLPLFLLKNIIGLWKCKGFSSFVCCQTYATVPNILFIHYAFFSAWLFLWISESRGLNELGIMKRISVFNNKKGGLCELCRLWVCYSSLLSCSEVDHYRVALAAHGYEISGSPKGHCCILLNG